MGLDMGEKRVGVALSDELDLMAHAVRLIERTSDEQVISEVKKLAEEHHIEKVVVGLPKTMKGEAGPQVEKVMSFVQLLQAHVSCPIVTWDERLTTVQAERALIAQDMSRANRKRKRDAISAEIMLQSYLDFSKRK